MWPLVTHGIVAFATQQRPLQCIYPFPLLGVFWNNVFGKYIYMLSLTLDSKLSKVVYIGTVKNAVSLKNIITPINFVIECVS